MTGGAKAVSTGVTVLLMGVTLVLVGYFVVGSCRFVRKKGDNRHACGGQLREVVCAAMRYAEDHEEALPSALKDLYPKYIGDPKGFSCPHSPSRYRDFVDGRTNDNSSSYTLVPGLHIAMPGSFVVAYEARNDNHKPAGRNVGFIDGHVEWWPVEREQEFQRRLAEQLAKMKDWKPATQTREPAEPPRQDARNGDGAGTRD